MSLAKVIKHLAGRHNQKRHGWRFSGPTAGRVEESERSEYQVRAKKRLQTSITADEALGKLSKISPYENTRYAENKAQLGRVISDPNHAREAVAYAEARTGRPLESIGDATFAFMLPDGKLAKIQLRETLDHAKAEVDFYKKQVSDWEADRKPSKKGKKMENPYQYLLDRAMLSFEEHQTALDRVR